MNDIDIEHCLGEVVRRIDHWKMLNAPLSLAGEMELNMIADEIEYLGDVSTKQLDSLSDDLQEVNNDLEEALKVKTKGEVRKENRELREELESRNADLREARNKVRAKDAEIDSMQATINDLDRDKKHLEEQLVDLEKNQYAQAW